MFRWTHPSNHNPVRRKRFPHRKSQRRNQNDNLGLPNTIRVFYRLWHEEGSHGWTKEIRNVDTNQTVDWDLRRTWARSWATWARYWRQNLERRRVETEGTKTTWRAGRVFEGAQSRLQEWTWDSAFYSQEMMMDFFIIVSILSLIIILQWGARQYAKRCSTTQTSRTKWSLATFRFRSRTGKATACTNRILIARRFLAMLLRLN
jgi:hypothetical protein